MTSLAHIRLDYAYAMQEAVGPERGLADADLDAAAPRFASAQARVMRRVQQGELGFWNLPSDPEPLAASEQVRAALPAETRDVIVLGIGGSSLGARAVYEALPPPSTPSSVRLHFPDNSDPWPLARLLGALDPRTTAVLVVSKSGGTVETAAQTLVTHAWAERALGSNGVRARFVAITDPTAGALRGLATSHGFASAPIPSNVGGRFSVLSAAGLLPALLAGIDVVGLRAGAEAMRARCASTALRDNPAGVVAAVHVLHHELRQRSLHVLMPYSDRLRAFGDWYVQLWAESLGKRLDLAGRTVERGPTPMRAVGATDQHAQVQLFMEGPRDKLLTFVTLGEHERDLTIPAFGDYASYLAGKSLGALLDVECMATAAALASDGRPSLTIEVERLDASALGGLIFLYEAATAYAAELYGVDAFDQPGVEHGKRLAYGMLGREGYADAAKHLAHVQATRSPRHRV